MSPVNWHDLNSVKDYCDGVIERFPHAEPFSVVRRGDRFAIVHVVHACITRQRVYYTVQGRFYEEPDAWRDDV